MKEVVEVRIPAHLVKPLQDAMLPRNGRESAVFALASHTAWGNKILVLVRSIHTLSEEAYVSTAAHGAKWQGRAMVPLLNTALAGQYGIVLFHLHGEAGSVRLSRDDRDSARQLLATFHNIVSGRTHASVVIGLETASALVSLPQTGRLIEGALKVRLLGPVIKDLTVLTGTKAQPIHHRQQLLIGSDGQRRLATLGVGVVGLSGGGGHIVQQLTHAGVGRIVGIDCDRAEASNRGRVIGLRRWQAFLRRPKVDVMSRMVRGINGKVEFERVPYNIPDQRAIEAVKGCDVIVGAVDNYQARADLQDLSSRYLIPYVDIGLLIQSTDTKGDQATIGGHVITSVPGLRCLWCCGCLTQDRLDAETAGRPRSYFEGTREQAQVVSLNGVLASQAVNEVLQLVTGYAPERADATFLKYDGLEGTLNRWKVSGTCEKCMREVGCGDPVWRRAG